MNQREERAAAAVGAVLPDEVAEAVLLCEAFGALAWKLHRAAEDGLDPVELLSALDPDDVAWTPNATAPAAFLCSRITY